MSEIIRTAGFKIPRDRKPLIDRKEYMRPDGTIDYKRLVKKVDELGIRLMKVRRRIEFIREMRKVRVNHPCLQAGACPVRDMGNRLTRRH